MHTSDTAAAAAAAPTAGIMQLHLAELDTYQKYMEHLDKSRYDLSHTHTNKQ